MTLPVGLVDFDELLISATQAIQKQQERLNEDSEARLAAFALVLEEARANGLEALALSVLPSLMALSQVEIETTFRLVRSRETQFNLGVQLLNLGYARRYAYSGFVQHNLQINMRRIPFAPDSGGK